MSDRMSSLEIEDVLSSIRRLVSEDHRPESRAQAARALLEKSAAEKLILTPALRVVATDQPVGESLMLPHAATAHMQPAFGAEPDEATELWSEPEPLVLHPSVKPAPVSAAHDNSIGAVVTALGAAVDARAEDWEAATGDTLTDGGWAEASTRAAPNPADFVGIETLDDSVPDVIPAGPLKAVSGWAQHDTIAFKGPGPDDGAMGDGVAASAAPTPSDWADAAEAEVVATLQADTEKALSAAMAAAPNAAFDEKALRDMVREMIREELAGRLGERITRNIRRLVRTEIARATSLRDVG